MVISSIFIEIEAQICYNSYVNFLNAKIDIFLGGFTMYDINADNIGKKIRYYRKAKNMSAEELGKSIGKNRTTINRYENNEIYIDMITALEICNVLNIDLNDLCDISMHGIEKENINKNPFDFDLLYLYYISKNGIVISSIEITENKYSNYVLMKNGLCTNNETYKQEYTGVMESNYNTAFICLTNAVSNPGLDKFQIEIDLHSKIDNKYYGIFLGISNNTHRPTARKCILTNELIVSKEKLSSLFEELEINSQDIQDIINTKYWDLKSSKNRDYIIKVNS